MIKGINKTEEERKYRAIEVDSSSSLKEFSMDRRKYYKRYYLRERVEEKENAATNMGKLVETLLLEPEEFDNRFYMSSCISVPTGLMLEFVEALYKASTDATDGYGVITRTMDDLTNEAYIASGFKITKEAVLNKFIGSNAEIYYREIREVRSKNLTVITTQDITNAEKIVEGLQTNDFTKDIINLVDSARYTVKNQLKISEYTVDEHKFKSMLDKVIFDHKAKTIQVYDLKCVWSVEGFYSEYYLYRRAYIQALLYYRAMFSLTEEGEEFEGYNVLHPQFIVCDSINYNNPLIYTLDYQDMHDAYNGFENNGRKYPGVKSLISDLKWAQDNDNWIISKTNYENKGLVNIKA